MNWKRSRPQQWGRILEGVKVKPEAGQTLDDVFQEFLRWNLDEEAEYAGDADGVTLRMSHMSYEGYRLAMRMLRQYMEQPQPAEDPDEWVIQDRVPRRAKVDQFVYLSPREMSLAIPEESWQFFRWSSGCPAGEMASDGRKHGFVTVNGNTLHVRCRRRDLPKIEHDWTEDFEHENGSYQNKCSRCNVLFKGHKRRVMCKSCDLPKPEQTLSAGELKAVCDDVMRWQGKQFQKPEPQPQKTRVRLWATRDGIVWMSSNACPLRSWQELHHDSEGFYVEG